MNLKKLIKNVYYRKEEDINQFYMKRKSFRTLSQNLKKKGKNSDKSMFYGTFCIIIFFIFLNSKKNLKKN